MKNYEIDLKVWCRAPSQEAAMAGVQMILGTGGFILDEGQMRAVSILEYDDKGAAFFGIRPGLLREFP